LHSVFRRVASAFCSIETSVMTNKSGLDTVPQLSKRLSPKKNPVQPTCLVSVMFPNDRWHNLAFQDGFESSSLII
jgi:hypothetical protein